MKRCLAILVLLLLIAVPLLAQTYPDVASVPDISNITDWSTLTAGPRLTGAVVGNHYPPTTVAGLANYKPPIGTFPVSEVTDATACIQGGTLTGGSNKLCRIGWGGTIWLPISNPTPTATPTPPANTFSVNNPCNTANRAVGGCTFNQVTYGAGGTPIPTLNVANTATVNCLNNSGDAGLFVTAMGSGGTAGNRKGIKVVGTQCDITSTVFIPPFVDIQGANSSTVILNPYGTSTTCNNGPSGQASFQINGPSQGGTLGHDITISNLTFSGINTIPPYYPGRTGNSGSACSSLTMSVLIEHASNITIEDNLFKNCTGQACVEALGGGSATPDNSNVVQNWNTYDGCALYGPDDDNVTNAPTNHNYALDCQFGNELDNPTQTGSYTVNYNYSRRRTSFGYNIDWVCTGSGSPGPATQTFYCATQNPTSCQMTGNILDATGSALTCTTFGSTQGQFNLSGGHNTNGNAGMTASQNYCYNGTCGCGGGIGGGCIIATPPNPAPNGP